MAQDFLQAASNAAASNVSGPVDALAWLLRKAGVPVPDDAVGGSKWMEQQGLTRPVKPGLLNMAGETAGLLAPIAAAAKAPQIAKGLLQMGENAAEPATLNKQRGVFDLSGMTREQQRDALLNKAEEFAAPLRAKGFDVSIDQSGSIAGPSMYASVSDPETGRFLTKQVRFSGHGKGPFQAQFVHEMGNSPDDAMQIYNLADELRSLGPSSGVKAAQEATAAYTAKTDAYWASVLQRAQAKMARGLELSNKERQAVKRATNGQGL